MTTHDLYQLIYSLSKDIYMNNFLANTSNPNNECNLVSVNIENK